MIGWFAVSLSTAFAQAEPAPLALSIEDALQISQIEGEAVVVAEAAVGRAVGDRWRSTAEFLPSLNLAASYTRTFASEFDQLFVTPTPGTPTQGAGGIPDVELPFGQDNAWRVDFQLVQPVFAGGRAIAQSRLVTASRTIADLGVDAAKATIALEVARAYYDAALADRLLQIAKDTLVQSEETEEQTRLSWELGRTPEFDLLRATVAVENQRVGVVRQERLQQTAHLQLRQLLDLPPDTVLDLTSRVEPDDEEPISVATAAADAAGVADGIGERATVQQAEAAVKISRSSLSIARSQLFPSVSASASYGWTSYPDSVLPELDSDQWNRNVSAGFAMYVPIFNGGRMRGDVLRASADVAEAEARAEQVRELSDLDTRDALLELSAAEAQWEATTGTVAQAQRAYDIAEMRYREGVSTQLELADARLLLARALANRAQAARDLQLTRIRMALLPALPPQLGGVTLPPSP
jgi:outer membrane protein TolC